MDNLTHSLVGLVAGEAIARCTQRGRAEQADRARRDLLVAVGVLGSNLPDLDLLWTYRPTTADNLVYMLGHRGYTHTLLGCAALALLLFAAAALWMRWRGKALDRRDRSVLAATAAVAVFGHLAMDALNSYGVHPFWPWNNRWYYGDTLFIVEPLFWVAALPLLGILRSWPARILLGAAGLAGLAAAVFLQAHYPYRIVVLLALGALLVTAARRLSARGAALAAVAAMAFVLFGFLVASRVAGERVRELALQSFPAARLLDSVLSPTPTSPGCWDVIVLQVQAGEYAARHGVFSLDRSSAVSSCPRVSLSRSAPEPVSGAAASFAQLHWDGQQTMPATLLSRLAARDCRVREWLQFTRVPYAAARDGSWSLSDLRFERGDRGFAMVQVPSALGSACEHNAPWTPPRADLLALSY